MLNLDEPLRNRKIFIISLFSIFQVWVLRVNFAVLIDNLDNWIRIFFRIRIQEAKILRIQRIRFLCTGRENNGNCQNSTLFFTEKNDNIFLIVTQLRETFTLWNIYIIYKLFSHIYDKLFFKETNWVPFG